MDPSCISRTTNDLRFLYHVLWKIACREAGIQPPVPRFRYLWLKRALRCRRLNSNLKKQIFEKRIDFTTYSKMSERLTSSQTLSKLKLDLSQELLEEYTSRLPTRAYLLEGVSLRHLTPSSCIAFQFRTETLNTKNWKYRHNQPLDTEPFNSTCRLCGS